MPRSPLRNEPPLLDADRAIRLVDDATALHRSFPELDDIRLGMVLSNLPFDAALFALETAADTGDPRVLAAALDLAVERRDHDPTEHELASIAPSFARDPLATRPAAEAAGLRGPLDRAAEALEKRGGGADRRDVERGARAARRGAGRQ